MSQQIDDGGNAFPVYVPEGPILADGSPEYAAYVRPGMSLRAWLAGQALAGLMANPHASGDDGAIARGACMLADAVIAELNRRD